MIWVSRSLNIFRLIGENATVTSVEGLTAGLIDG